MWDDLLTSKFNSFNNEKMKMFHSMSHELRTPLNCSITLLNLLQTSLNKEGRTDLIEEYINPSLFTNKLLLNQVNDMLDAV